MTARPAMSRPRPTSSGCGRRLRLGRREDVAERHELALPCSGPRRRSPTAPGDRREDAHVGRRHRVGDVVAQARDPVDLHARRELELVAGDRRADGRADEAGVDAELVQRRLEDRAALLDEPLVDRLARRRASAALAGGSFHAPGAARRAEVDGDLAVGLDRRCAAGDVDRPPASARVGASTIDASIVGLGRDSAGLGLGLDRRRRRRLRRRGRTRRPVVGVAAPSTRGVVRRRRLVDAGRGHGSAGTSPDRAGRAWPRPCGHVAHRDARREQRAEHADARRARSPAPTVPAAARRAARHRAHRTTPPASRSAVEPAVDRGAVAGEVQEADRGDDDEGEPDADAQRVPARRAGSVLSSSSSAAEPASRSATPREEEDGEADAARPGPRSGPGRTACRRRRRGRARTGPARSATRPSTVEDARGPARPTARGVGGVAAELALGRPRAPRLRSGRARRRTAWRAGRAAGDACDGLRFGGAGDVRRVVRVAIHRHDVTPAPPATVGCLAPTRRDRRVRARDVAPVDRVHLAGDPLAGVAAEQHRERRGVVDPPEAADRVRPASRLLELGVGVDGLGRRAVPHRAERDAVDGHAARARPRPRARARSPSPPPWPRRRRPACARPCARRRRRS